jgi:hypothetical protein
MGGSTTAAAEGRLPRNNGLWAEYKDLFLDVRFWGISIGSATSNFLLDLLNSNAKIEVFTTSDFASPSEQCWTPS